MLLNVAKNGKPIVTMEENVLAGGFGSAVLEALNDAHMQVPVLRIGLPDVFVAHGDTNRLKDDHELTPDKMAVRIVEFINKG